MERVIASAAARSRERTTPGPFLGPMAPSNHMTPAALEAAHIAVKGASVKASERLRQALMHRASSTRAASRRAESVRLPDYSPSPICSPEPSGSLGPRATSAPSGQRTIREPQRSRMSQLASGGQAVTQLEKDDGVRPGPPQVPLRDGDGGGGFLQVDLEDEAFIQFNRDRANAWINECKPFAWRFHPKDKQLWEVQAEERRRDYHFRRDLLRKMGTTPFNVWLSEMRAVREAENGSRSARGNREADTGGTVGHKVFQRMFVEQRCERSRRKEGYESPRASPRRTRRPP